VTRTPISRQGPVRIIVATGMLARCAFAGAAARSYRCAANPKRTRRPRNGGFQTALQTAFDDRLREDLAGRIAPLDRAAAEAAGQLAARREAAGRPVDVRDINARLPFESRNIISSSARCGGHHVASYPLFVPLRACFCWSRRCQNGRTQGC
jgi:hypothetical protein